MRSPHISEVFDKFAAADAILAPVRTLGSWVERQKYLPCRPTGRWEFSVGDLMVLAIVRPLVEMGMAVETAAYLTEQILKDCGALKGQKKRLADAWSPTLLPQAVRFLLVPVSPSGKKDWRYVNADDVAAPDDAFIEVKFRSLILEALKRAEVPSE